MAILERNVRVEAGLIDELLEASELLAGQTTPRFAPVDLVRVLEPAVSRMLLFAQHRGVDLQFSPPADGVIVAADRRHLGQVATHLVSHAVRCARPGGSVTVECVGTPDAVNVRFTTQSRASESGWHAVISPLRNRLPDALCDDRSLGLSVVREILAMHGGALRLQRAGRSGTVWTVTLPARAAGAAAADSALDAEPFGPIRLSG
jgi:signal transduction histidine kinase